MAKAKVRGLKRKGKSRILKPSTHQVGKSKLIIDARLRALLPGKRRSRSGGVYYEYRRNRSDVGAV